MTKTRRFMVNCLIGGIFGIVVTSIIGHVSVYEVFSNWGGVARLSYPATAALFLIVIALWIMSHERK